jgi:ribosomal protein S18 acetylase RimI-like enzyme
LATLFAEPLQYRFTSGSDLHGYEPLVNFCCGKARRSELEVNLTARRLYCATAAAQLVVLAERQEGQDVTGNPPLVGTCGLLLRPLQDPPGAAGASRSPGVYINAIGLDLEYKGRYVQQGGERRTLGELLLDVALDVSRTLPKVDSRTYCWALVREDNRASNSIFERAGFQKYPPAEAGGQAVLYRAGQRPDRTP